MTLSFTWPLTNVWYTCTCVYMYMYLILSPWRCPVWRTCTCTYPCVYLSSHSEYILSIVIQMEYYMYILYTTSWSFFVWLMLSITHFIIEYQTLCRYPSCENTCNYTYMYTHCTLAVHVFVWLLLTWLFFTITGMLLLMFFTFYWVMSNLIKATSE